ncbi:MAG: hypothetical protein LBI02_11305 [Opitutaceae bacterium]|jgi:hypothetical protein|nr:hypothetical protein [Opitutaceae bacterium]
MKNKTRNPQQPIRALAAALSLLAAALALAACTSAPKPVAHTIALTLDKSLENTSLQVDIIGANATSDLPKWESYSITEYWQPGNSTRRDTDRYTVDFGRGKPASQKIGSTDAKWTRWLQTGATYVVVIADLPGIASDQQGNADPRRLILPLDAKQWKKAGKAPIEIQVKESGLRLLTPRNLK